MFFCFVLWSPEFNQGHLSDPESQTLYWSLTGSPVGPSVKTMAAPAPLRIYQQQIDSQGGVWSSGFLPDL